MINITAEQLIEINIKIGAKGRVINRGNLELIVDLVGNAKDITDGATELLFETIALHAFVDGNKRTAFLAMDIFLKLNGKTIKPDVTEEYLEKLVHNIAIDKVDKKDLKNEIKKMIE